MTVSFDWIISSFRSELGAGAPNIAKLSITLGVLELIYTAKEQTACQVDFQEDIATCEQTFQEFVDDVKTRLQAGISLETRGKIKLVADLVWSKLSGVFSKEVLHAQHLSTFCQILQAKSTKGKRQLDCAGVVTTVLAVLQQLALLGGHDDLRRCCLQVSEDHCWINMGLGEREESVEVTTDTAAKRGLAPSEQAWRGWLYNAGHAVVCSPKMAITALVASLNPAIVARQNSGIDSEEIQLLQKQLLELIKREYPEGMYPAALCALADLQEIEEQDALDSAVSSGSLQEAVSICTRHSTASPLGAFEAAIALADGPEGSSYQWYPYSYICGYLVRRAVFIIEHLDCQEAATRLLQDAGRWLGNGGGASVLRKYRYTSADGELYKDIEGVIEGYCGALAWLQKKQWPLTSAHLVPLLELWDGVCCLFEHTSKPSNWLNHLLRAMKLFTAEMRADAASHARVSSKAMTSAAHLWGSLKPAPLKMIFGAADVEEDVGRATKRPKR
ncbi:g7582 [Coccomyxa elongata]